MQLYVISSSVSICRLLSHLYVAGSFRAAIYNMEEILAACYRVGLQIQTLPCTHIRDQISIRPPPCRRIGERFGFGY